MPESLFSDVDAEDVVVFVSFQTLLSVEGASRMEELKRLVPVEGHFTVVGHPWGPQATRKVLYDKGFAHSPGKKLFPGTHECKRDWIRRLEMRHGIAPEEPLSVAKTLVASDCVQRARRFFHDALNSGSSYLLVVDREPSYLLDQLEDVFRSVECFRSRLTSATSCKTVVFVTLHERLNMVRGALRWFASMGADLPQYAVVAMEEFIPASNDFLDEDNSSVRYSSEHRCEMHQPTYTNIFGTPHDCCRADVRLVQLVGEYIADYLAKKE